MYRILCLETAEYSPSFNSKDAAESFLDSIYLETVSNTYVTKSTFLRRDSIENFYTTYCKLPLLTPINKCLFEIEYLND